MTQDEIRAALMAAVTQIQTQSQRDVPPLHGGTRIIGDVPGCDSLAVVEVAITLTEILAPVLDDREIPEHILLGAGKGARPTLDEIATSVADLIQGKKSPRSSSGSSKPAPTKSAPNKPASHKPARTSPVTPASVRHGSHGSNSASSLLRRNGALALNGKGAAKSRHVKQVVD
jgi:hypothetical protein